MRSSRPGIQPNTEHRAIVDVITGELNPSGRLPVSVARSAGQIAIYYNHAHGSAWHQGESIGFPDYVDSPHTPRYPFGHGLSYTSFEYANLNLSAREVNPTDVVQIGVDITNTGDRAWHRDSAALRVRRLCLDVSTGHRARRILPG